MADVKITVRPNGPYRVEAPIGSIEMVDATGAQYDLSAKVKDGKTAFSLCRCGASVNKPFCDGTHSKVGFQAAEAAVKAEGTGNTPAPVVNDPSGSSPAKG
jgi:CDGSH-type Zn-finger protein